MKFAKADFKKIRISLLVAVLAIAAGAVTALFSLKQIQAAQLAEKAAAAEHTGFESKLRQVRNEENEIKQKSALFSNLQARGIIGEEQRLDWVELLKDIRDKRRLLSMEFEISPQRTLDSNPGSNFVFYSSTMKLQLKLLHEEDLTRLLDDLRSQARALIQVKSCNVSRLPRSSGEQGNNLAYPKGTSPQGDLLRGTSGAQLQADCQIDWITAREAKSK